MFTGDLTGDSSLMEQVAQGGCGCPIPVGIQGKADRQALCSPACFLLNICGLRDRGAPLPEVTTRGRCSA